MENEIIGYKKTNSLLNDVKAIIERGLQQAYRTAETVAFDTYCNIGTRTLDRNISTQYYGRMMAAQKDNANLPASDNTIAKYSVLKYSDQLNRFSGRNIN